MIGISDEEANRMILVRRLVYILRTVIPLAAAAQAGRCYCGRAIPWFRTGWARPTCTDSWHGPSMAFDAYDVSDTHHMTKLEEKAESICGLRTWRGWSR